MMADSAARQARTIAIARHPIHSILFPVPVVCCVGVLLTDVAYVNSAGNLTWLAFSSWLLLAGLFFGVVAAIVQQLDAQGDAVPMVPPTGG